MSGTLIGADWLNDVQDEFEQVYAAAGIPFVKGTPLLVPVLLQIINNTLEIVLVSKMAVFAPYPLVIGQPFRVGSMFGQALTAGTTGQPVEAKVTGELTWTIEPGSIFAPGSRLYWDDVNRRLTPNKLSGYLFAGLALSSASGSDTQGTVRMLCTGEEPVP